MRSELHKILIIAVVMIMLCGMFPAAVVSTAFAAPEIEFDKTDVLEDLKSAKIDGRNFSLLEYPYIPLAKPRVIVLSEYGYSEAVNKRGNYGLYLYVYNPGALDIEDVAANKIQIAKTYSTNGQPDKYTKLSLKLVSKSVSAGYANLFLKFKVIDASSLPARIDNGARVYDVSGIELKIKGDTNATEYKIGGSYRYEGYAEGFGLSGSVPLTCTVKDMETVDLKVRWTNYRTGVSSLGKGHYNDVNSVYFAVPKEYFDNYGYLQSITSEWWEYKIKPALVTSDSRLYSDFLPATKVDVGGESFDCSMYLYNNLITNTWTEFPWTYDVGRYDWAFNVKEEFTVNGFLQKEVHVNSSSNMIPYVFYAEGANDIDSFFNFLKKPTTVGNVGSTVVSNWINTYYNALGHGYYDVNGRQLSKDLFELGVDDGRTLGYNLKKICLDDTFVLQSYDSNHSWLDKFFDFGWSAPETGGSDKTVLPIVRLTGDVAMSAENYAEKWLVNKEDVPEIKAYVAAEELKGNQVMLFRHAVTDYYTVPVGAGKRDVYGIPEKDGAAYIAQETIFLDYDIISLGFMREGNYTEIAAVSSPIDIIPGLDAPPAEKEWWKILLGVLGLILIVVILAPLLPYLIRFIVWVVTLPFKAIKAVIGAIKSGTDDSKL